MLKLKTPTFILEPQKIAQRILDLPKGEYKVIRESARPCGRALSKERI